MTGKAKIAATAAGYPDIERAMGQGCFAYLYRTAEIRPPERQDMGKGAQTPADANAAAQAGKQAATEEPLSRVNLGTGAKAGTRLSPSGRCRSQSLGKCPRKMALIAEPAVERNLGKRHG